MRSPLTRVHAFTSLVAITILGSAPVALAIWAVSADAFPQYSQTKNTATYCRECHGDFNSGSYVSLHDDVPWNATLMDGHKGMLEDNCDFCHSSGGRFPVLLNSSVGGISCLSCHGRLEPASAQIAGSGLRQHHYRLGYTVCADCHADANPAVFPTASEATRTPFQQRPAGTYLSGPNDPCDGDGSESVFGAVGLDNDGDLVYDALDPDCIVTDVLRTPVSSHLALIGVLRNPLSSPTRRLQVVFTIPRSGPTTFELFDIHGRLVVRRNISTAYSGRNTVDIELPHRPFSGVYLLRLTHAGESVARKVVLFQ